MTDTRSPESTGRAGRSGAGRLGLLAAPDVVLTLACVLIPVGLLIAYSFGRADPLTQDVSVTGTLDSYRTLFSDLYRPVLARSGALAALTVVACAVVGTPAALAIARLPPRWRDRAVLAVLLPSFVSFTVRIFAFQGLLGTGGPIESVTGSSLLYTPGGVLIGMAAAYLPLYVLPAYSALSRLAPSMIDAAADLGARRTRQTFGITLPLALPGLVTGAVLVGVLALGEFIIPTVLGGGKVLLIGKVLADRGAGRDKPIGGAIVVTLLAISVVVAVIVTGLRRWERSRA